MTNMALPHEEDRHPDTHQAQGRSARVNRRPDGEPIGASIFLNSAQLAELGIQVANSESLAYSVENGRLRLVRCEYSFDESADARFLEESP